MIKSNKKEYKILACCVLITLLFLFTFNVTYSYFTAIKTINGTINFSNLEVCFTYNTVGNGFPNYFEGTTLTVYPTIKVGNETTINPTIDRGNTFALSINVDNGYTEISSLSYYASEDSCDSYIRFMVDAYIVNGNTVETATNYGQYFEIQNTSQNFTKETVTNNNVTNIVYYMNAELKAGNSYQFATGIKLLESAPVELLGNSLKITISFNAVQKDNKAFASVFNDGWGYLSTWE